MNSKFFWPISACAHHARSKFAHGYLIWPLGLALMLSFASPNVSFGISLASLSGTVYVDTMGDGVVGPNDWGVRGALIQLIDSQGIVIKETNTDLRGQYFFTDVNPGTYTVRDTIPSFFGDVSQIGQMFNTINNTQITTGLGTPNSALLEVSGIVLDPGFKAINYNFSNDQYPLQLYSKYMLVAQEGYYVTPAIVTPVPEPIPLVGLIVLAGLACVRYFRRRR